MARWADFLISAVKYSPDRRRIIEMKQHQDRDEGPPGEETMVDRSTVAANIKKGISYVTVFNAGSKWKRGDRVRAFIVDGEYYIRTDENKADRDNLGTLPEFE